VTGLGLRGRRLARLMLAIVVGIEAVVAFLFLTAPPSGPLYVEPPGAVGWLVPAVGVAVNIAGLAWMIRICHADPEAHPSFWRFRRR